MSIFAWLRERLFCQRKQNPPPARPESAPCSHAKTREPRTADARTGVPGQEPGMAVPLHPLYPLQSFPEILPNIPQTLGNLLRDQGDFEQAIQLRELILEYAGTDKSLKALAYFEMGRDYRQAGFLDRAFGAFQEAKRLGHPESAVAEDMARLFADSGDFAAAAELAAKLGNVAAHGYYLVKQAEELVAAGEDDAAMQLLRKALFFYPASPEARLALASMHLLNSDVKKSFKELESALAPGTGSGRLILLEGLYAFTQGAAAPDISQDVLRDLALGLSDILVGLNPGVTECYYGGLFLQAVRKEREAEQWFTKALVLEPEFWAARLALLSLYAEREDLPPILADQIAFFTKQGAQSKRFLCPPCGLRRDTVFSQCPLCRAWHSAQFRMRLT